VNNNKDIPNEVWVKIEEFQKKGAAQNFKVAMDANLTVIKVNNDLIGAMEQIIGSEE